MAKSFNITNPTAIAVGLVIEAAIMQLVITASMVHGDTLNGDALTKALNSICSPGKKKGVRETEAFRSVSLGEIIDAIHKGGKVPEPTESFPPSDFQRKIFRANTWKDVQKAMGK